ncbi:MAG: radical SAM protein [Humidesulfovibrio sp.]
MKILLVSPPYALLGRYYFPVGIAYVSGMLKQHGFDVVCHNSALEDDWQAAFRRVLARERPDVLGVGALTPSYPYVKWMLQTAKEDLPGVTTLLGGGILGSEPDVFDALKPDIGVVGEGEAAAVELLHTLEHGGDLGQVAGILYRDAGGKTIRTAPRPFIEDLDTIPIPDYEGFNFRECYAHLYTHDMISSRGCPFHCTFCYSALGRGKHRAHSIDYVIREIRHLVDTYGVSNVGLMDEVFALRKERILEFCEKVKPLGITWYAQMRCGVVDEDLLATMREAGCHTVFYGLESMSTEVLRSMNKKLKPAEIERALELTYQSRMESFGNFIFGDPAETTETAWETLQWWVEHRQYFVNLGKIDCWPGTKIYHDAVAGGVVKDKLDFIEKGCPLTNMTKMPWDEFLDMLKRVWALHEGVLWPGRLLAARLEPDGSASARLVCPHCQAEVVFEHLEQMAMHGDRNAHRPLCELCHRRFDIPLRLPPVAPAPELQTLFDQALAHRAAGRLEQAMDCLLELFKTSRDHPVAVVLGASIRLAQGYPDRAKELVRLALRNNPAEPFMHDWAALCYSLYGDERMAGIFRDHAQLLRECRSPALAGADLGLLDPMEVLYGQIFPGGVADAVVGERPGGQ